MNSFKHLPYSWYIVWLEVWWVDNESNEIWELDETEKAKNKTEGTKYEMNNMNSWIGLVFKT